MDMSDLRRLGKRFGVGAHLPDRLSLTKAVGSGRVGLHTTLVLLARRGLRLPRDGHHRVRHPFGGHEKALPGSSYGLLGIPVPVPMLPSLVLHGLLRGIRTACPSSPDVGASYVACDWSWLWLVTSGHGVSGKGTTSSQGLARANWKVHIPGFSAKSFPRAVPPGTSLLMRGR